MMEVSCTKCISPNVDYDLIEKYSESLSFFDINKNNKYYYCIADAENKGYVVGYQPGTSCED
ncbi:MAG: hypothetical protein LBD88_03055 [Candidatus Peribacteria bacterium]|jgi:hypothetical protein|nr:hypothetical protein [Candidatus Peribacteria bacterium]